MSGNPKYFCRKMEEDVLMSKIRKPVSVLLAVLMFLTIIPFSHKVKASDAATPLNTYFTVAGSMMSGNSYGDDWSATNAKGLMKEYEGGLYELTLHLKAGNYEYKIVTNGSWDNTNYGSSTSSDGNIQLAVASEQNVTFRFDYNKKTVTDNVNNTADFKTSATVTGSMEGWDPTQTGYDLTYVGGGFYSGTLTIPAGSYQYKVAYNHAWSNGEVSDNVSLTASASTQVTFLANPTLGICEDSVSHPEIADAPSLIGTVRSAIVTGAGDWDQTAKGWELSYLADKGLYVYSAVLPAGSYSYKAVDNYSWTDGGVPASGNISLTVPTGGQYVIFVCDEINKTLNDSINNPDAVAKALGVASAAAKGTVLNKSGTVTFNYKDADAKSVYLQGDVSSTPKLMSKDAYGNWSTTLRLGDTAKKYGYQFVVDGTAKTDPTNSTTNSEGQSVLDFPGFTGRKVVLAGTLQGTADGTWNPAGTTTVLTYQGNGVYTLTLKNLAAGSYAYKVALDGSWTENYGLNGVEAGSNIPLTLDTAQDVTFTYSDDSHHIVNSVTYHPATVTLEGSEVGTSDHTTPMTDPNLTSIYSASLSLKAGTYSDFKIVYAGNTISLDPFTIDSDRTVVISYDPVSDTSFTDASSKSIDTNEIYFNSQDTAYKSVFGAVTENTPVTFSIKAAKGDLTAVKLVVINNSDADKTTVVNLSNSGTFDDTHDKWSGTFTPTEKGLYKYYFVLTNGAQVKAYGDDDGMLGTGKADDIGAVMSYDLNVSETGYTTPDWLKNAIVYQIFPDRFFDGDTSNDTAEKVSRGSTVYQYHDDWYSEPYSPALGDDPDTVYNNDLYGGDLTGIDERLDYLQALGVTTLYLNPISESVSNHRYDTSDYSKLDSFLGNMDDYVKLAQNLQKRGMHLIIDGVYNHVSDDSVYFDRYGKYVKAGHPLGAYQYWKAVYDKMNADSSLTQAAAETAAQAEYKAKGITDFHYKDWFVISNKKVAAVDGDPAHYDYDGWDGYDSMPEIQALNGSEDNVTTWKEEILAGSGSTTDTWLNNGASGVRLDASEQLSDHTWQTFRSSVKSVSSDDAIIGEIWTDASKYLLGDEFDSVMNYMFRGALTDFVSGAQTSSYSTEELEAIRERYPKQAFQATMNIVDSHDTARILTTLNNDTASVATLKSDTSLQLMKLVSLMQMTYPGAPTIYYGDELGMIGGSDPDCRRAMAWGEGNKDLVDAYALYGNIRDTYAVLRTGDVAPVGSGSDDILSYVRTNSSDSALVLLNRGKAADGLSVDVSGKIANGTVLYDATTGTPYTVTDGKVTVSMGAVSGLVLVTNYQKVTVNEEALKPAYDSSYIVPKRDLASQEATTDDQNTVSTALAAGKTVIDVTGNATADLMSVALEQGLSVSISSNNATLTLSDSRTAVYINEHNIATLSFTADTPDDETLAAIKKAVKNGKANLLNAFSFTINLPEGALYDGATLTIPVDASYNGKTVYIYYYDSDTGKVEKTASAVVANGFATFAVAHLSTYFVTDAELASNPGSSPSNGGGASSGTSSATSSGSSATSGSSTVKNPDTGSDSPDSMPIVPLMVMLGAAPICLIALKKKRGQ